MYILIAFTIHTIFSWFSGPWDSLEFTWMGLSLEGLLMFPVSPLAYEVRVNRPETMDCWEVRIGLGETAGLWGEDSESWVCLGGLMCSTEVTVSWAECSSLSLSLDELSWFSPSCAAAPLLTMWLCIIDSNSVSWQTNREKMFVFVFHQLNNDFAPISHMYVCMTLPIACIDSVPVIQFNTYFCTYMNCVHLSYFYIRSF